MELGASFVHSPQRMDNSIAKYIKKHNWPFVRTHNQDGIYYYEDEGIIKDRNLICKSMKLVSEFQQKAEDLN